MQPRPSDPAVHHAHRGPVVIASGNGLPAATRAWELIRSGMPPLDAVVEGCRVTEDDPRDVSVGYGGLPNAEGVVELDAAVMDAETHRVGAVAALRGIRHAAAVAREVLLRCDHDLLVGEGATRFALRHGFPEEDLLSPEAAAAYEQWKNAGSAPPDPVDELYSDEDRWLHLNDDGAVARDIPRSPGLPYTHGTMHIGALAPDTTMACATTTSGLSYKLAGRVGDSPIVGHGLYCERGVGSAGATGRGESGMESCAAYDTVRELEAGLSPTDACLATLRRIVRRTRNPALLRSTGTPRFNITIYALRADGAFGSAALYSGYSFAVHDEQGPRRIESAFLFERPQQPEIGNTTEPGKD
ncbi:MAG: N(4)-(beta-N-acetylglucosaminyl)-L-asparaginase [Phycisphaerales bacterium]